MRQGISRILMVGVLLSAAAHAATVFTLNPLDGALFGAPGSTVGWGFTLDNDTDYLLVTLTDFCVGAATSPCSNTLGTYTDFAGPNFIVVGPAPESPSVTESFDNSTNSGVGSFVISAGAVTGNTVLGHIILTYDLYSVSPNDGSFDPAADLISSGNTIQAAASVTVGTSPLPEPGTFGLMAVGLMGAGLVGLRMRRLQVSRSSVQR